MIKKIPQDTKTFKFYNANPKNRKTGDCVVRAISTASGKAWEEVFDGLYCIGLKYKVMIDCPECFERLLDSMGWIKQKQPRKMDGTKYTGKEFCEKLTRSYENGYKDSSPVIANIGGHHMVAIVFDEYGKFKVNDTWDSTDGCIGKIWIRG